MRTEIETGIEIETEIGTETETETTGSVIAGMAGYPPMTRLVLITISSVGLDTAATTIVTKSRAWKNACVA